MLNTILFTLLIVTICILLLGIKVFFVKGGKFPNGHVSGNKALRDRGISCAQSQDREAQKKSRFSIDALEKALNEEYDLIFLDLMLPEVDGFDICRQVRQEKNIPIIMVSAKKDDIDKIRGLGLGADDYMTKPFSPSELVARVKAHLARYERLIGSNVEQNEVIELRGLKIDKTARRVWVNGEEKSFTTKEFDLLTFLAGHPNHVYSKEELFRELWDMESIGDIATVTVHI